jgi:transposase InsO family protein
MACEVLSVSRSGSYAFSCRQKRSGPPREVRHLQLSEQVQRSFVRSRGRYGAPRITEELSKKGTRVSHNTVAKILKECGLFAKPRRRFVPHTTDSNHNYRIAPNRLKRRFKVDRLDTVWAGDITYIRTAEGWLYLATLMDLFSRKIVGWAMSDKNDSELTCSALNMAIQARAPAPGLICHSDRGSQYACRAYQKLLKKNRILCSMSRRGDCYDNAPAESLFATIKGELLNADEFESHRQAKTEIFEYIEVFYNRKRLHSALGYQSPEQFEATHRAVPKRAPTKSG